MPVGTETHNSSPLLTISRICTELCGTVFLRSFVYGHTCHPWDLLCLQFYPIEHAPRSPPRWPLFSFYPMEHAPCSPPWHPQTCFQFYPMEQTRSSPPWHPQTCFQFYPMEQTLSLPPQHPQACFQFYPMEQTLRSPPRHPQSCFQFYPMEQTLSSPPWHPQACFQLYPVEQTLSVPPWHSQTRFLFYPMEQTLSSPPWHPQTLSSPPRERRCSAPGDDCCSKRVKLATDSWVQTLGHSKLSVSLSTICGTVNGTRTSPTAHAETWGHSDTVHTLSSPASSRTDLLGTTGVVADDIWRVGKPEESEVIAGCHVHIQILQHLK